MPLLFSYGTLQQPAVQLSTFGRVLTGHPDQLVGFEQSLLRIDDPQFVAASGTRDHAIVKYTGRDDSRVAGMVFEVSESELADADAYEPTGYTRISTRLASGQHAWVYADATHDLSKHLRRLKFGSQFWNVWRAENPGAVNLDRAVLDGMILTGIDLSGVSLNGASLHATNLMNADLRGADLTGANLSEADLIAANLEGAILNGANLREADLRGANLHGARYSAADLSGALHLPE